MGYHAQCDADGCSDRVESPLLLGQFSPQALRTTEVGGILAEYDFDEGSTITLCPDCTLEVLTRE